MSRIVWLPALIATTLLVGGCEDGFANACTDDGGVVKKTTKTGTGWAHGPNGGGVVVTTQTFRFCVVNGRVVAVE